MGASPCISPARQRGASRLSTVIIGPLMLRMVPTISPSTRMESPAERRTGSWADTPMAGAATRMAAAMAILAKGTREARRRDLFNGVYRDFTKTPPGGGVGRRCSYVLQDNRAVLNVGVRPRGPERWRDIRGSERAARRVGRRSRQVSARVRLERR